MSVTNDYSGVVLDQNAIANGSLQWRDVLGAQTLYQTFLLPSDYEVGSTVIEERYPDLSGLQVMVTVDARYATTATLDYVLEYYVPGTGYETLTSGTSIGTDVSGQIWFTMIFPQSVPINATIAKSTMRIGITAREITGGAVGESVTTNADGSYVVEGTRVAVTLTENVPAPVIVNGNQGFLLLSDNTVTYSVQQGISDIWYVSPTPLVPQGAAFQSDGVTPLLGEGASTSAFNFRVLALTADHGVDFLGNEYRACVIQQDGSGLPTTSATWTSPALPSQFAVVSRYYDMRPEPAVPLPQYINFILDPSFEWDVDQASPFDWAPVASSTTDALFQVQQGWSYSGEQSLRSTSLFHSVANATGGVEFPNISVSPTSMVSASCIVNLLELPTGGQVTLNFSWYSPTGAFLSTVSSSALTADGVQSLSLSAVAPSSAVTCVMTVICTSSGAGTFDFYIDDVCLTFTAQPVPYFDGDALGCEWLGQRGQSPSAQLEQSTPADDTVVIDGIMVDPSTPNMAFNVYYSIDDAYTSDNMTESDWESKLWARVPEVYIATQAQQYVFPAPVAAKYMKVEFTNLQAQTFTPGPFAQPVAYKKFPTWVADFFIAQLELPSFVASSVNVVNDALSFAYSYYLDDIMQTPAKPNPDPTSATTALTSFFNQNDVTGQVDATTLSQINLVMQSFQLPTGSIINSTSLLGQSVLSSTSTSVTPLTSESSTQIPTDYSTVSSTTREPVVFEQSLPVMYFFLTCRHAYKELVASFEYNRAYFAGVNDITFLRHNYSTATDSAQYIESGNDTTNAIVQDFDIDTDQVWYTY